MTDILLEQCASTLDDKPATWSTNPAADAELVRRVFNFLAAQRIPGLDQLRIVAQGGEVTLQGVMPSQHYKRRCADFCQHVAGVVHVHDRVEVLAAQPRK